MVSRNARTLIAALSILVVSTGCSVGTAGIVVSADLQNMSADSTSESASDEDSDTGGEESRTSTTTTAAEEIAADSTEAAAPAAESSSGSSGDPCPADEIYAGSGFHYPGGGVIVESCDGEWAYAQPTQNGQVKPGDGQFLARKVGGEWTKYSGFPTTITRCEAREDGVPTEYISSFINKGDCSSGSSSSSGGGSSADLGLGVPMTQPSCDGRGIVVLYSAVVPGQYKSEISSALSMYPGAKYLRTDHACTSLRQRDDNGNLIYAVYRPSGYSQSEVCADVRAAGGGAYGRWLSNSIPSTHRITC